MNNQFAKTLLNSSLLVLMERFFFCLHFLCLRIDNSLDSTKGLLLFYNEAYEKKPCWFPEKSIILHFLLLAHISFL